MPYCRHCRREYTEPLEQCPACHHLLLASKPTWRPFDPQEALEEIRTVQGEPEAIILQARLEQEGIPVVIQRDSAGVVLGLTVDGLGAQRLLVPKSLVKQTERVLRKLSRPPTWPRRRRPAARFRRDQG